MRKKNIILFLSYIIVGFFVIVVEFLILVKIFRYFVNCNLNILFDILYYFI